MKHDDASVMNLGAALHELAQRQPFDVDESWAQVRAQLDAPAATPGGATPQQHNRPRISLARGRAFLRRWIVWP
jgi:hypothetical protein